VVQDVDNRTRAVAHLLASSGNAGCADRCQMDRRSRADRSHARPFGQRLLDLADLRPGVNVLDIGCGTGATSAAAWERVAPGGSVVGLDISPVMLAEARARSQSLKNASITWVAADAQTFAFPPRAADVALSRFGVAHFADTVAAFAEDVARRALPQLFAHHHHQTTHSCEFADGESLQSLLMSAGFRIAHFERFSGRLWVGSAPDDVLEWLYGCRRAVFSKGSPGVYLAGNAWMVNCRA
jgi:SAM-dependent methyltransferase